MTGPRMPRLVRPLVLERPVAEADGGGGFVPSWAPVTTLWVEVRPLSAREALVGAAVTSRVSHRIRCRAMPEGAVATPRSSDRLREGGRAFLITGVVEESTGGFLTIWAEETAA